MVETAVLSQSVRREKLNLTYARWKEGAKAKWIWYGLIVKAISRYGGVEIKWSNRYFEKPNELKSLISFCKNNNLPQALATSIDKFGVKQVGGLALRFNSSLLSHL